MSDYFASNLSYLRDIKKENQEQTATALGLTRSTLANYEAGSNMPKLDVLEKIIGHFGVSFEDLVATDLRNVHLNQSSGVKKKRQNVHLNVHPNVHLKPTFQDVRITVEAPKEGGKVANSLTVPITDISVAAGAGVYNEDYITNVDSVRLPVRFLKKSATYLCVKIKGSSMAPTLLDGGYVIIRLLDRSEWAKMPDERVFVVASKEGKAYLKRVKNRFKNGFIVLRSDNPDYIHFPSINLDANEINSIWEVEWYFTAKMPNMTDDLFERVRRLEDRLDDLSRINPKLK